jgi:O-antigen ligase
VIPILVAIHFALPGTLGTFRASFLPSGGLIQEQTRLAVQVDPNVPTWCNAAARLKRVKPMLEEVGKKPAFGYGYGTRITGDDNPDANTCVLDDQWLGVLVETGAVGAFAWLWFLLRFVRRVSRTAAGDYSRRGWLLASLGASLVSFLVGMLFFDAFSFIQVTLLAFILIGLGSVVLRLGEADGEERAALPGEHSNGSPQAR